jgi:hypothetical protein
MRLQPAGFKRHAGGPPIGATDTWRWTAGLGSWARHSRWPRPRPQPLGAWSAQPWALGLPPCVLGRPSAHVMLGLTASVLGRQSAHVVLGLIPV